MTQKKILENIEKMLRQRDCDAICQQTPKIATLEEKITGVQKGIDTILLNQTQQADKQIATDLAVKTITSERGYGHKIFAGVAGFIGVIIGGAIISVVDYVFHRGGNG